MVEWCSVTTDKTAKDVWWFQAQCGSKRMFRPEHFHDPYGAAVAALDAHRCGGPPKAPKGLRADPNSRKVEAMAPVGR